MSNGLPAFRSGCGGPIGVSITGVLQNSIFSNSALLRLRAFANSVIKVRDYGDRGFRHVLQKCEYCSMGWLSLWCHRREPCVFAHQSQTITNSKTSTEHVEIIEPGPPKSKLLPPRAPILDDQYPLQDVTVSDDALPFIPPNVVRSQRSRADQQHRRIWIVVDEIVYDCTNFVHEHPGGDTVIRSFIGEDSSWQFWKFHSRLVMDTVGRPLRTGRTEGIENRFKEPPRYVGLSKSRWLRG